MSEQSVKKRQGGRYDLTQGGIIGKLLLVALPIMGTQLMQMTYNLTDMFWLGRVSSDVVAASGTAGNYLWLSNAFMLIGRMGSEIGVSQHLGRGEEKSARRYAQNSLFLAVLLGVIYGAFIVLLRTPLIGFFNIRETNVAADAARYLLITGAVLPATFISGAVAGCFNGSGNSLTPFLINTAGLAFNMILDPLLIIVFDMSITGAAIATAISQLIVCALSLIAIRWKRTSPFRGFAYYSKPDKEIIRQIFKWSIPVGLESMLFTLLSMIVSRFVSAWGADAIAIQRVGSQIESLSWLIAGGFGTAVTAFVGQNYGAGKWSRIHKGCNISTIAMVVWGIVISCILYFAGGQMFGIFLPDPKFILLGGEYLQILAICQLPLTLEMSSAGTFRGIGRTLPPSIVSIASNIFRVPLSYFLSLTSLGMNGLWLGVTLGCVLRGAWIFLWYLYMKQKQPREDLQIAQ